MADENCIPCTTPTDLQNDNPAGVQDPNEPAGVSGTLPVNPPVEGPGPVDPGISIDLTPPNYAGDYPRQNLENFRKWCQTAPTFKMIQGLIMTMLANHFGDVRNIENPFLRQYVWTPDDLTTGLVLNIEEDWSPNIINRKPAVYIKREAVQVVKLAINDMEQGSNLDGRSKYDVLFQGSHTLRCYGNNSLPPDDLAFEVATLVIRAAPVIRNYLSLANLRVTDISAKVRDDTAPAESYFSSITVPWAFVYRYQVHRQAPQINVIDLSFFK